MSSTWSDEDPLQSSHWEANRPSRHSKMRKNQHGDDQHSFSHPQGRKWHTLPIYQYASISSTDIRLLRISPGATSDPMIWGLKQIPIDKITSSVLSFQALSYAWGKGAANDVIMLSNIQNRSANSDGEEEMSIACRFLIRADLLKALRRIRHPKQYVWIWANAL
jgi:hypothetical protein